MQASNTIDRMATYDFKAPIDIVYFEENSDDEVDLTSSPNTNDADNSSNGLIDLNIETEINIDKHRKTPKSTNNENELNVTFPQTEGINNKTPDSNNRKHDENRMRDRYNIERDTAKRTMTCITNTNNHLEGLKSISKYLIRVLEYLHHYTTIYSNQKTNSEILLATKRFLATKYRIFNAAYEDFNTHILPNENNQAFIHKFIDTTIEIANKRMKTDCNKGITEIYFELMNWVKRRNYETSSDCGQTSVLRQQLENPVIMPTVTISERLNTAIDQSPIGVEQSKLCIFSKGPPGRHININVDKSLINNNLRVENNNILPKNVDLTHNSNLLQQNINYSQNAFNMIPENHNFVFRNTINQVNTYGDHQNDSEFVIRSNNVMQPLGATGEYISPPKNRIHHYTASPGRQRNFVSDNNAPSNALCNYYHTTNTIQSNHYYGANGVTRGGNGYTPNVMIHEDGNVSSFKTNNNFQRMASRGPPPTYNSAAIVQPSQYQQQMGQPVTTVPTVLPGLPSGPELTRTCVSTDSGFVSPVGSKSNSNPLEEIMNDLFELENSIQPSNTPAQTTATCHVCHQNARLMCSACYKTNYCNTKCQSKDWDTHRRFCQPYEKASRKLQ